MAFVVVLVEGSVAVLHVLILCCPLAIAHALRLRILLLLLLFLLLFGGCLLRRVRGSGQGLIGLYQPRYEIRFESRERQRSGFEEVLQYTRSQ